MTTNGFCEFSTSCFHKPLNGFFCDSLEYVVLLMSLKVTNDCLCF